MMRNIIITIAAALCLACLFVSCGFIDRLEAVGAGYDAAEEGMYSAPLNAAAREFSAAVNSRDPDRLSSLISGSDYDSAQRLISLLDGMIGYRIREESRSAGVCVCLMRADCGAGTVRLRIIFDEKNDPSSEPVFLSVEAADESDFRGEGFSFSSDTEIRGISFPVSAEKGSFKAHPSFDRDFCSEDYRQYDQYHELAAAYLQAVVKCLDSYDADGLFELFSTQARSYIDISDMEQIVSVCDGPAVEWTTSGSYVTVSGKDIDEYNGRGERVVSVESDRHERVKAVFDLRTGSADYKVTLSVWAVNDPEPYRIGLEGIRIAGGGISLAAGKGI